MITRRGRARTLRSWYTANGDALTGQAKRKYYNGTIVRVREDIANASFIG
jgi:hypothetical protein